MTEKDRRLLIGGIYLIVAGVFLVATLLGLSIAHKTWGQLLVTASALISVASVIFALNKILGNWSGDLYDAAAFIREDPSRGQLPEDEFKAELTTWRAAKWKAEERSR